MGEELPSIVDAGHPANVVNSEGQSQVVLVCEHASKYIPLVLGTLGLEELHLSTHIAWDLGAERVARGMSKLLDAPLVLQRYSRLVYDCNRPPEASSAMPVVSELTEIPGNRNLSDADRQARIKQIYEPFHAAVSQVLMKKQQAGSEPVLVSIHSFTPVYKGIARAFDLGVLHDEDSRLADAVLGAVAASNRFEARRNQPYGPQDGVLHTLNLHCRAPGLLNLMIEIKNDLIADRAGQTLWSNQLAALVQEAVLQVSDHRQGQAVASPG